VYGLHSIMLMVLTICEAVYYLILSYADMHQLQSKQRNTVSMLQQSFSQIITTNVPTTNTQFFTGQMSFLSPNQQCESTEGKIKTQAVNKI